MKRRHNRLLAQLRRQQGVGHTQPALGGRAFSFGRLFAMGLCAGLVLAVSAPAGAQDQLALAAAQTAGNDLVKGDYDRSLALLSDALSASELSNESRALLLNDRAMAYWRLGDARAAIGDFNQAITLYPEMAALYNNRGIVLLGLGMAKEAVRDFDRAVLLAPGYAAAYSNRATSRVRSGALDEAIADFGRALVLAPSSAASFNGRGQVHMALNRPRAAERDFSQSITLDAKFDASYRARAEVNLALEQYHQAIDDLSSSLTFQPGDLRIYLLRGKAQLMLRDLAGALRDYNKAIQLDGRSAAALSGRGYVYVEGRDYERALADFNLAVEADHRHAAAYSGRARVYLKTGSPELALPDTERAMKLDPNDIEALRTRAEVYEALSRFDESVADLRKLVSLAPGDDAAWTVLERLSGERRPEGREIATGGLIDGWRLFIDDRGRYYAQDDRYRGLRVPIETFGSDAPTLIDWEPKLDEFRGIGILRFMAGKADLGFGVESLEYAAVININQRSVVTIEPYRLGGREAVWTWKEDGELAIRAPDGISSNYKLGRARVAVQTRPRAPQASGFQRSEPDYWSPFGSRDFPTARTAPRNQPPARSQAKKKPKNLFDFLFN